MAIKFKQFPAEKLKQKIMKKKKIKLLSWLLKKLAGFEPKIDNATFLLCHQRLTINASWLKIYMKILKAQTPCLAVDCKKR